MKAEKLRKGTTVIEVNDLELEALQEMLDLVQRCSSKSKSKDRLQPRHHDFIKHLGMQLDRSKQVLLAADKMQSLKERLREALHISPGRQKGVFGYSYIWSISYDPEKAFGIKLNCAGMNLYLSIGCKGYFLNEESQGSALLYIRPHDYMTDSEFIKLDHQATIDAALAGQPSLRKYLKDQLLAYMAARPESPSTIA